MYSFLDTICISGIFYPAIVKILKMVSNQQETKVTLLQVGSPETLRSLSFNNFQLNWNQWLAGLIDGDGCFLVSKAGYISCEITMGIEDEHALLKIKQKLGGSVKVRAGMNAIRYRLHNKLGMIDLITRVNGHIRNPVRLKQLKLICDKLNITLLGPCPLDLSNGWFSGFFDADGTITLSLKNGYPQLTISVSNKYKQNVMLFKLTFGGNIYFDKGGYGSYKWSIQSEKDIELYMNYIKQYPSRSHKKQRLFLVPKYYKFKNLKAYKNKNSILYKVWQNLLENWKIKG